MFLDAASVLSLAAACAPGVAPETLLAISRVESGLNPLAIGVNGPTAAHPRPRGLEDAVARARRLIAAGADVDLGLAQINVRNFDWLGLTVEAAFDPCRNLAAAAQVLEQGYRRAAPQRGEEQRGLRIALSYYNTGHAQHGFRNGYVARVVAAAGRSPPTADPTPTTAAARPFAPPPSPPAWDVFSRARGQAGAAFVFPVQAGAQP